MTWDVIGLGENSVDEVYRVPALPAPGGKIAILDRRISPGGQVATMVATCAALGLRAGYVGAFGSDAHGARVRDELQRRGVDLSCAVVRSLPNRYAVILVDAGTGERIVLGSRDPALALQPSEVPAAAIAAARLLHVDGVDEEASLHAARLARRAGREVTTDIDRATEGTRALLAEATIPILAATVPFELTGEADPVRALRALRLPHHRMVCVTRGAQGALLVDDGGVHEAPGFAVPAVDTTGAGDVFRGAFVAALLRGDPPAAILRFACAAAAVSCTKEGALGGVPTRDEVDRAMS